MRIISLIGSVLESEVGKAKDQKSLLDKEISSLKSHNQYLNDQLSAFKANSKELFHLQQDLDDLVKKMENLKESHHKGKSTW